MSSEPHYYICLGHFVRAYKEIEHLKLGAGAIRIFKPEHKGEVPETIGTSKYIKNIPLKQLYEIRENIQKQADIISEAIIERKIEEVN